MEQIPSKKLESIGFEKSAINTCLFYKGKVLYLIYTDDSILTAPTQKDITDTIKAIRGTGLKIKDEGELKIFLGVNIRKHDNGSIEMTQPN